MAKLKPWYQVITPREDLREGRPLDASEFAVHLDHIRDDGPQGLPGARAVLRADLPDQEPERPRRPGGPPALRHQGRDLGRLQHGDPVRRRQDALADPALPPRPGRAGGSTTGRASGHPRTGQVKQVPKAATAVFVGTEFDSITGRGGANGEPRRRPPGARSPGSSAGRRRSPSSPSTTRRGSHRAAT